MTTPHNCSDKKMQPPTHFVGIGGAGMSAIAQVLKASGCQIQGSDRSESPTTLMLRECGIPVFIGHEAANIGGMERVVYTRAVPEDNPEILEARRLGLPLIERAEMLGELYELFQNRLSVTGTHGKTSTSAMLGHVLVECGQDPTVLIGGESLNLKGHARLGCSQTVVAEACEAYSSFLHLRSSLALVTNVDADHLDWYGDFEGVKQGFLDFLHRVDEEGLIVACADDLPLMSLRERVARRWITYGFDPAADVRIINWSQGNGCQQFTLVTPDGAFKADLPRPGAHLALNAAGTVAGAVESGCTPPQAIRALSTFIGVKRRMELKGDVGGVLVLDDYAHHPTEIRATLTAAREGYGRPITVIFQPHLYSRTSEHLDGFVATLLAADRLVITDVYAAREDPARGVESDVLYDRLKAADHPNVEYVPDRFDVPAHMLRSVQPGDLVMTVGAGNIFEAGEQLVRRLQAERGATPHLGAGHAR